MNSRSKLWKWLVLIPFVYLVTLKTHRTYSGDGDEPHYLLIAESLYDDGDLWLDNQYPDRHSFMPQYPPPGHGTRTPSGLLYPIHDIGLPVLMLPTLPLVHAVVPRIPVWVQKMLKMDGPKLTTAFFSIQSMLVASVLAVICFWLLQAHGLPEKKAFFFALWAILAPPLSTFGYLFFTEIYSAALVAALALLFHQSKSLSRAALMAAGVFILSWLHVKNSILAAALGLAWAWSQARRWETPHRWISAALPLGALAAAMGLRALLHRHYFGQASLAAPWGGAPLSPHWIPSSFFTLFLDREYGLFWANPVFWLLPAGIVWIFRRKKSDWGMEGLAAASYVGGILFFRCWYMGWSPAARHLVTIIPLLWIPLAVVLNRLWSGEKKDRRLVAIFAAASGFLSLYQWQCPKWFWFQGDGHNPWMEHLPTLGIPWQHVIPSLHFDAGTRVVSVAVFVAFLTGLNTWVYRRLT